MMLFFYPGVYTAKSFMSQCLFTFLKHITKLSVMANVSLNLVQNNQVAWHAGPKSVDLNPILGFGKSSYL